MQYYYILSPRQAQRLLWSIFITNHGRGGRNVEADLHTEHLIRVCKSYLAALGANVTDAAVLRAGKCIGTTSQVTAQYDTTMCVHPSSDRHSDRGITKDLEKVVGELDASKVFCNIPGRTHAAFKNFKTTRSTKEDLESWM